MPTGVGTAKLRRVAAAKDQASNDRAAHGRRRWPLRVLALLIGAVTGLLLAELGLRIAGFRPTYFNPLQAFHELCRSEGIIPALESAHAVAQAMKMAPSMKKDAILLVNLSGRGDKDMHTVAERAGKKL